MQGFEAFKAHTAGVVRAESPRSQRRAADAAECIIGCAKSLPADDIGTEWMNPLATALALHSLLHVRKMVFLSRSMPDELGKILQGAGAPPLLFEGLKAREQGGEEESDSDASSGSDAAPYDTLVEYASKLRDDTPDWTRTDMRKYLEETTKFREFDIRCAVDEAFSAG
mmetsp:Transcript_19386/g.64034  ORF Transcript_19386/g.64034 Transcript_19386/m.64034 type:complete len:169 (+) Transcript_19386:359-865(+)